MEKMLKPSISLVKFLCSYGGKILPSGPSGQLRYVGGEIRVLSVDRSFQFTNLLLKFEELCGYSVSLRCQLPKEDLDTLVTITSDEELALVIKEYDETSKISSVQLKIKVFLSPPKSMKKASPRPSLLPNNRRYSTGTKSAQQTPAIRNLANFSKLTRMEPGVHPSFPPRLPTTARNYFSIQRCCIAF